MTSPTFWLGFLKAVLSLAVYFAQRAMQFDTEKALKDELDILQGRRVRAAADARDRVLDGTDRPNPTDPYKRD